MFAKSTSARCLLLLSALALAHGASRSSGVAEVVARLAEIDAQLLLPDDADKDRYFLLTRRSKQQEASTLRKRLQEFHPHDSRQQEEEAEVVARLAEIAADAERFTFFSSSKQREANTLRKRLQELKPQGFADVKGFATSTNATSSRDTTHTAVPVMAGGMWRPRKTTIVLATPFDLRITRNTINLPLKISGEERTYTQKSSEKAVIYKEDVERADIHHGSDGTSTLTLKVRKGASWSGLEIGGVYVITNIENGDEQLNDYMTEGGTPIYVHGVDE